MDNQTQQYRISLYPRPEDGGSPSSAVLLEITGDPEGARQEFRNWKKSVADSKDSAQSPPEGERGFRVCGGDEEDVLASFGETDILSSLLAWFCDEPGVLVKELSYRGAVYTDISLSDLAQESGYTPDSCLCTRMRAKRDGRDAAVYFMGPYAEDNFDELRREWLDEFGDGDAFGAGFVYADDDFDDDFEEGSGDDLQDGSGDAPGDDSADPEERGGLSEDGDGASDSDGPSFEDYCKGKISWSLSPRLSSGIVEAAEGQTYAGMCSRVWLETYVNVTEDASGSLVEQEGETEHSVGIHLFLEANGQDLTFSVLLGGRLYKKISRDAEKVVFYYTPLDRAAREGGGFRQGENPRDLIFRNTGGEYRRDIDLQDAAAGFSGAVFVPPQTPDFDSLDAPSAYVLYAAYLRALFTAVSGAEAVQTPAGVFRRVGDDRYQAETEDFRLTGKHSWGMIYKKSGLPTDALHFKEAYDGEDVTGSILVESASFSEEGTGNRIALLPKDAYTITKYEKDQWGDDALDNLGRPIKRYTRKGSVLEILITGPGGEELYQGDFGELRKGNVFETVNLPEAIRFSRRMSVFARDLKLYQAIRQGILNYSVRRIVNVFTRAAELSRPEMEQLLYFNGEVPDDTVTDLAIKMKRRFIRNGEIPDIALVGQAGTGKSTIAANLAKIFGREIQLVTGAELKGSYLGHTASKVVKLLAEVLAEGKILFIDEAYELMSDKFGREAVALLLPVISKDRSSVSAPLLSETGSARSGALTIDFEKREIRETTAAGEETRSYKEPGFPPIWIAGYEDEIRLMLGMNKGLYRRMERVTMKTPAPDELYQALWKNLEKLNGTIDPQRFGILTRQFKLNQELLLKFFRWGTQPQNSRYFANYAGVGRLLNNCVDGIDFTQPEEQITRQLSDIITSVKRDVKRQLDVVLRKGETGGASSYDDTEFIHMIYDNETRFTDLVGCGSQVGYMQSIIDMLLEKNRYDRLHMTVPKGALLLGPPGVGKTFIARAMAGELQEQFEARERETAAAANGEEKRSSTRVGFMSLSAPELVSKPVRFIGSVFDKAEEYDICVIFIDEVDAIAKRRMSNPNYSHFIELIKQMDGVEQRSNVFILAATNAPEALDPAFTRSGRIDKKLIFTLPDQAARRELALRSVVKRCGTLRGFVLGKEEQDGVEKLAGEVAAITPGRTPGDIENLVNTAFILYDQDDKGRRDLEDRLDRKALRFRNVQLDCLYDYIYEAVEQASVGDLRPIGKEKFQTERNDESRSSTAVHEVGHALVEILLDHEPFEKITSLPRGRALGYVMPSRKKRVTKADFEDDIRADMGGRAAEEIVYGRENISPGASEDIAHATRLAHLMVERWGFSEEFEFMALVQDTAVHLGESAYTCSETYRQRSDQAANELLKRLYQDTMKMLEDKKELIKALAKEVFDKETMTGKQFKKFYDKITKRRG